MWYEVKTGERVNKNRVSQATETDANILAAACNFCNIMLEDGVKTTGNENRIKVKDVAELVAEGYDPEIVQQITRLVDLAEYKRRQSPPGPRISMKAFGKDRRLPITNRYR